jgi:hypothetical protein
VTEGAPSALPNRVDHSLLSERKLRGQTGSLSGALGQPKADTTAPKNKSLYTFPLVSVAEPVPLAVPEPVTKVPATFGARLEMLFRRTVSM